MRSTGPKLTGMTFLQLQCHCLRVRLAGCHLKQIHCSFLCVPIVFCLYHQQNTLIYGIRHTALTYDTQLSITQHDFSYTELVS